MSTTVLPDIKCKILKSKVSKRSGKSALRISNKNHIFRKRLTQKPGAGSNIIYVNTKTNFKAIVANCVKLIRQDHKEIILYCLGAAIQRGASLALQICDQYANYQMDVNTFSTVLIDDLEPITDDADYETQKRHNSILRVRLCRTDLLSVSSEKKSN